MTYMKPLDLQDLGDDELLAKRDEAIQEWRRIKTADYFRELFGDNMLQGTKYGQLLAREIHNLNHECDRRKLLYKNVQ